MLGSCTGTKIYKYFIQFYHLLTRYFTSVWMQGSFPPQEWNLLESDDLTTSNAAESTNWIFTVKTGQAHPNIYSSCAAIKNDLKESEHLIDLANLARLQRRRKFAFERHQTQRIRLKESYRVSTLQLRRYKQLSFEWIILTLFWVLQA